MTLSRALLLALLLVPMALAQVPDECPSAYPPDACETEDDAGTTPAAPPIPPPPPASCPCGTVALMQTAAASCTGTINPTCSNPPPGDPSSLVLNCDPGGVDPPGIIMLFAVDDGGDQCWGAFQEFLGPGMGYSSLFDTGGYIAMTDAETTPCQDIFYAEPAATYCGL